MTDAASFELNARHTAADFDPRAFDALFRHELAVVDGVRLHHVEGGHGDPVLLVPGWPQSWYAWRMVMPALVAAGHRVIAIDPRGMGDSGHPARGFDVATVAAELHAFIVQKGLAADRRLAVMGHDVGAWIAYALASDWPQDVRRLALFEAALPGVTAPAPAGIPSDAANVRTWHFAFNRLPDLPEILVQGHERAYLNWLFAQKSSRPWAFPPEAIDEYTRAFVQPGGARAAFGYYRDNFGDDALRRNGERAKNPLAMPVLAIGGEFGVGSALLDTLRNAALDVRGAVLAGCGHFVMEESPAALLAQVLPFLQEASA